MAKREYIAYLLRLWREKRDGSWRALLENPNSGERNGFATLTELVTFLEGKTGESIQVEATIIHNDAANAPETKTNS